MKGQPQLQKQSNEVADKKHIPTWREMNWDTSPEAEAVLFKLWRDTPAWRKLEMMDGLNQTARQLALRGLHNRFPNASPEELQRRLATMTLGEELATRVYGPRLAIKDKADD